MPYPNQHAARMRDPSDFEDGSFRTLRRNLPAGVSMIVGSLKEDAEDRDQTVQAYRFDIDEWTEAEAREWLKEHDHDPMAFEPAEPKEKGAGVTACLMAYMPAQHLAEWARVRDAVVELLGEELETPDPPHITLLYYGEVGDTSNFEEIAEALTAAYEGEKQAEVHASGVGHFGHTENSAGRTPILLTYDDAPELAAMREAALENTDVHVHAEQFPEFVPHTTLGYLGRELTDEEREALGKIPVDFAWPVGRLTLSRGDNETFATFPLVGYEAAHKADDFGGLPIAVRDRMRQQALRKLDDEELMETHAELHGLWRDRPEDADLSRYVNAHIEILAAFAERDVSHPDAPEGTADLDERSADVSEMKGCPSFKTIGDLWDGWGREAVVDAGEVFVSPVDHHCAHVTTYRARDRVECESTIRRLMESQDAAKIAGIRVAKASGEQAVIPADPSALKEKAPEMDGAPESAPPLPVPADVAPREGDAGGEGVRRFDIVAEKSWMGERRHDGSRLLRAAVYKPLDIDTWGEWTDETGCLEASIHFALAGMVLNDEHNRRCSGCGHIVPISKKYPPGVEIKSCPKCKAAWAPVIVDREEAIVVHNAVADATFRVTDLYGNEQVIPKGTWIVSVLVRGKALERIESGEIKGFSFEGMARSEDVD